MSVVGEYTTRFDADLAAAQLSDQGLESTVLSGHLSWPHDLLSRVWRLVVRDEVAEHAQAVLDDGLAPDPEVEALDALYHHRRFADRPAWVRWTTVAILAAVAGPLVLSAVVQLVLLLDRLFPG
jgi:hypothetical protein